MNAQIDVHIDPSPSLEAELDKVLPPAKTGTVPKQISKLKSQSPSLIL